MSTGKVIKIRFNYAIPLIITIVTMAGTAIHFNFNNLEVYAQGSNETMSNFTETILIGEAGELGEGGTVALPAKSLTLILDAVDKANAALSSGDDQEVSQQLQDIETEVRDQLGKLGIQISDKSSAEIDDVLVQEDG